ncbi:MAG: sulfotransferase [Cyanobacteria bacterium J06639_1]
MNSVNDRNLVIIIGRGNSGTRIISYTLYASGVFMGATLNPSGDKVPTKPLINACDLIAPYIQWKGNLSWDFSRLYTEEIPTEFKTAIAEYLADIQPRTKNKLAGWKLPETTLVYPWIARLFPNAKYIFWVRDPRDCVTSGHTTDDLRNFGIDYPETNDERERRAISWYYQYKLIESAPTPKHALTVRFEDFVLKQDETLAKLARFLDRPLSKVIVKRAPIGRWRSDSGKHSFEYFDEALRAHHYDTMEPESAPVTFAYKLLRKVRGY